SAFQGQYRNDTTRCTHGSHYGAKCDRSESSPVPARLRLGEPAFGKHARGVEQGHIEHPAHGSAAHGRDREVPRDARGKSVPAHLFASTYGLCHGTPFAFQSSRPIGSTST